MLRAWRQRGIAWGEFLNLAIKFTNSGFEAFNESFNESSRGLGFRRQFERTFGCWSGYYPIATNLTSQVYTNFSHHLVDGYQSFSKDVDLSRREMRLGSMTNHRADSHQESDFRVIHLPNLHE